MNYQEFKKEIQKSADACGVSEEEIKELYHHFKYGAGKISKEEGKRIAKIMAAPESNRMKLAGINGVKAGKDLGSVLLKLKDK